jgi:hypothetical protein
MGSLVGVESILDNLLLVMRASRASWATGSGCFEDPKMRKGPAIFFAAVQANFRFQLIDCRIAQCHAISLSRLDCPRSPRAGAQS